MPDSVTVTTGFIDGLFQAKVEMSGNIKVDVAKVLKRALKEAGNFPVSNSFPSPKGDSVTVTAGFNQGLFEAKVDRSGYIEVDVAEVLSTAMKEAVNFDQGEVEQADTPIAHCLDLPSSDDEEVLTPPVRRYIGRKRPGCREPRLCFKDGQKIRHKCRGADGWWVGVFHDSPTWTGLEGEGMSFSADDCISQFARAHYYSKGLNPSHPPPLYSYWNECECQIDGQWVSTYNLPSLY